jgi:hypothetical protein
MQIPFHQFTGPYAQVAGQPVDVLVPEDGTGRFAAVGAAQAVNPLEGGLVGGVEARIQILRGARTQVAGESAIFGLLPPGFG